MIPQLPYSVYWLQVDVLHTKPHCRGVAGGGLPISRITLSDLDVAAARRSAVQTFCVVCGDEEPNRCASSSKKATPDPDTCTCGHHRDTHILRASRSDRQCKVAGCECTSYTPRAPRTCLKCGHQEHEHSLVIRQGRYLWCESLGCRCMNFQRSGDSRANLPGPSPRTDPVYQTYPEKPVPLPEPVGFVSPIANKEEAA